MKVKLVCLLLPVLANIGIAAPLTGKKAPELTIKEWVTSNPPKTAELKHKVYVVEFWATWCTSCVANMDHLNEINEKYRDLGLEFIALSQDKSIDKVRKVIDKKKVNYHVAIDNGTVDWFKVECYPTAFVVDHKGTVIWQGIPFVPEFEKAIKKALAAGPPPIVAGADLGPFKNLKKDLAGGKRFAKSYERIAAEAYKQKDAKKLGVAGKIILTINRNIAAMIKRATQLETKEPAEALKIYTSLIKKYDGIEAIKPAKSGYLRLKKLAP